MRNEKFKFINDSMANHRIDESNSEYSASIVSNQRPRKNTRRSCSRERTMVVEETEEDESEESKTGWNRR